MQSLYTFEKILAIIGLLFFSGSFSQILPNSAITLLRYFVWIIPSFLICLRWKSVLRTASQDIYLWILTALLLLSFLWSDVFRSTMRESREVVQMTSFGLYLAARFSLKELVQLVASTFGLGALMSVVVAIGIPSIGIHQVDHPGAWKGVYGYKNNLGSLMIINAFTFFLLSGNQKNFLYKWAGFGLAIALILLSTSKTSLTVSFILFLILHFYRNFRWQGKITVFFLDIAILLLGVVATVVLSNWVDILSGLGKDPTLTGRTPMWGVALTRLWERPWLGYGRTAFWAPGSQYAREAGLAVSNGFTPPHAHNGFIDLALDVGLIGITFFVLSFAITYARSLKRAYATQNSEDLWPLAFLIFLFMNNITESFLLYKTNVYWVLYVATALSVSKRKQTTKLTSA